MKRLISFLLISVFSIALSIAIFSVLMFTAYELVPDLVERYPFDKIRYLANKRLYQPDEELAFRLQSGLHHDTFIAGDYRHHDLLGKNFSPVRYIANFNDTGFRVKSHEMPTEVAVFGDSFIECGDRDDNTFPEHLASELGVGVENFGTSYYGPPQYLRAFERYGTSGGLRVALFGFFEGNDIVDIKAFQDWEQGKGYYGRFPRADFIGKYTLFMTDAWKLSNKLFLEHVRQPIAKWRGRLIDPTMKRYLAVSLSEENSFLDLAIYDIETRPPEELLNDPYWQRLEEIMQEFKATALERSISPYFIFIPSKLHTYIDYVTEESAVAVRERVEAQRAAKRNTERAFGALCKRNELQCVSLTGVFRKLSERGVRSYYRYDTHWNDDGRKAAAQYVAKALSRAL